VFGRRLDVNAALRAVEVWSFRWSIPCRGNSRLAGRERLNYLPLTAEGRYRFAEVRTSRLREGGRVRVRISMEGRFFRDSINGFLMEGRLNVTGRVFRPGADVRCRVRRSFMESNFQGYR
jgi:hypothetical protein